jgi:hypothetical protein
MACAGVSFQQERVGIPVPNRAVTDIRPGSSDLHQCLQRLGAPTEVGRSSDGRKVVLTWTWQEHFTWGFFLTLPLGDFSPSMNWADASQQPHYVRLFFDRDWRLVDMAQG